MSESLIVSIVIPYYNREKTIRRALEGIVNQTFQDWECMVVDDGSSPESLQALQKVIAEISNPKIRMISRPSARAKGANACRNLGVEYANGRFIAFLDSDDSWKAGYLANAIEFAQKYPDFDASFSGAEVLRNGIKKEVISRAPTAGEGLFDFLLSPGVLAQTSSYFVKKDVAEAVLFDETLKRHQDYDFFIRLGHQFVWRHNPSSFCQIDWSTISTRKTDFASCIKVYQRHEQEFSKDRPIKRGYLISCLGLAYKENADKQVVNFYRAELRKVGHPKSIGLLLMINFPQLFRLSLKLRK